MKMFLRVKAHWYHLPRQLLLLLFLTLLSNLKSGVEAHWINLHVWHDDLFAPEPLASTSFAGAHGTSNNGTVISPPGGGDYNELPNCQELDGLTDAQIKLCLLFFDHMVPVIQGAKLGLTECQWQFRYHHWNCSTSAVIQSRVVREDKRRSRNSRSQNQNGSGGGGGGGKTMKMISHFPGEIVQHSSSSNSGSGSFHSEMYGHGYSGAAEAPIFQNTPSQSQSQGKKHKKMMMTSGGQQQQQQQSGAYKRLARPAAALTQTTTTTTPSPVVSSGQGFGSLMRSFNPNHYIVTKEKSNWNTVLARGSKEVAFAHAIWSAAVTDAVARACRDGSLTSCGCGKTPRPPDLRAEWRWGGCGDNLQYGYKFAQSFVDIREQENTALDKKAKARSLVNLHNNEAGRRAVLKKTKIACKCHGVSGSCALVTCWHQIPSFREIGDYLKDRYAQATQVKLNKRGRLQVKRSGVRVPSVFDLVFIEQSPNYCVQNETLGIFGTTGRVCNRTSSGPGSCKSLCCNRGFKTNVVKSQNRCNCKFIWCCQVVCEECRSVQKFDVCN